MIPLIVPAGPGDAEALGRLHVECWRQTYRGLLPDAYLARMSASQHARRLRRALASPSPGEATLALEARDGLLGYASGGPVEEGWAVHTLYLLRRVQGRGEGRRLLGAMARIFTDQGGGPLLISALRENVAARAFYERLGGVAKAQQHARGPGGIVCEVKYFWPDVSALIATR